MRSRTPFVLVGIALLFAVAQTGRPAQPRQLMLAERVAYQYAIEEVYWRHRIWPKENPRPKPSLDAVMSSAQIEKKVNDYLRNSQLLAEKWRRPITSEQLQTELERMARDTKQPEVLREIFAALGNDPAIVAECFARPILIARLLSDLDACDRTLSLSRTRSDVVQAMSVVTSLEKDGAYTLPEVSGAAVACGDNSWNAPTPVDPRTSHTAVWTGGEMIIWGGTTATGGNFLNTGGKYDPSTDTWTPVNVTNAPAARKSHTAVWTGSEMIIWGGYNGSLLNSGARYNPTTGTWTATNTVNAPTPREYHTAVWTGSEMIVWGGANVVGLNTGGRYNPSTNGWTATPLTNTPAARYAHTAVWTEGEMIVWAGINGGSQFNTGGRYNPNTDSWTATSLTNAPAARSAHSAVWTGSEMIIWGGYNGSLLNSGGRYNPGTDSWIATGLTNAPAARSAHTAVWTGSEMIIWGGYNSGELNTGGKYNPGTDNWTSTTAINAPTPREGHTAVWTGAEMIIWGGDSGSVVFSTGGKYSPSSNSWTGTANAPEGRYYHTAVWTGIEMIVWGGTAFGTANYVNTGGKYSPSTDSWTATSTINAPSGRFDHTAVWTGTHMIIWGGIAPGYYYLNTGGRYNPATDIWSVTGIAGAPAGRAYHTAVWTGDEMIVWGGVFSMNSGGRYTPSTDSWAPTTTVSAPAGRSGHTSVWTGREMIVWGGNLNTGGRYDPRSNTWISTSDVDAPLARSGHTAIWTGDEMIVWGGSYYNGQPVYVNSGGRYNPGTDSWIATTVADAPSARNSHTAVWTGTEMVIWGGFFFDPSGSGNHYFNSGGRYKPTTNTWTATSTANAPVGRQYHTALWTGTQMIVWGGQGNTSYLNTGGTYCAQPSTPIVQSVISRKTHINAGSFEVNLPLTGTPGIECRTGGATSDYAIVITFLADLSVNGTPQAVVTSGTATVGSGGMSNGGAVIISGNVVTIPLTNVANAQTINVTLNSVNGTTNVVIPMSVLVGDVNGNGTVNASDVALTKSRIGQAVDATNFRSDVNASGGINAGDVSQIKSLLGTGLP